jgi:tetratricopeptide (TPR) repeat protein
MGERRRLEAARAGVLVVLLLGLTAAFSLTDLISLDYWWHLRTGERIAATGEVPTADAYTYSVPGARWVDMHWLFQLGLHRVYDLGGHRAVIVGKGVLAGLLLGLVGSLGYRRDRPEVTALALGLLLLVASNRFLVRPEMLSFVLLAALIVLLERYRVRGLGLWAVAPIQLLWANVHGLFAVGIAVCGLYTAAEALRPLGGRPLRPRSLGRLVALTLLAAAVSAFNPNGLDGAFFALEQLGMITESGHASRPLVSEISRLLGPYSPALPLQQAAVVAFILLTLAAMIVNPRLRPVDALLWGSFAFLALSARRNAALLGVVLAPILVRSGNAALDAHPLGRRLGSTAALVAPVLLALALVTAGRGDLSRWLGQPKKIGFGVAAHYYPERAADWIARERPPGRLFHFQRDGGYLIWRLYPAYPVLVDGRLEVFGAERLREFRAVDPQEFRRLDERFDFGTALVSYRHHRVDRLVAALHADPAWRLCFVGEVAVVFVRLRGRDGALCPALDLDRPDLFAPLNTEEAGLVLARIRLLAAIGRFGPAARLWDELGAYDPALADNRELHAMVLAASGQRDRAHALLKAFERDYPHDAEKLGVIAGLHALNGDAARARRLRLRALALDPSLDDRGVRIARARLEQAQKRRRADLQARAEVAVVLLLAAGALALGLRRL